MPLSSPRPLGSWAVRAALIPLVLLLAACGSPTAGNATPTPPLTPQTQVITIDAPLSGGSVANPFELRGRTALFPEGGALSYRVFDTSGAQVGSGAIEVAGAPGQPGSFAAIASYSAPASGAGRVEVVEVSPADGSVRATAAVPVNLASGGAPAPTVASTAQPTAEPPAATAVPLPTAVQSQAITIDSPPPGTEVGSPMTITGRTTLWPFQGNLAYRVVDGANRQLGAGTFAVIGTAGQPATFNSSITFTLPSGGGPVRVEVYDQNATNNVVTASAALDVRVAVPQAIVIETPAPGTTVGSPVTITGRTARYPYQGNLAYRILGPNGAVLGQGVAPVSGGPGQPGRFNASIAFNLPQGGGAIQAEFTDQDAATGVVAGRATVPLTVAPPQPVQQQIFIDTPPRGTTVGSPVTITGRTARLPAGGQLSYLVRDLSGATLGSGSFPVTQSGGGASFVASVPFTIRSGFSGDIFVAVIEYGQAGAVVASTDVGLFVAGSPVPPTAAPSQQAIVIETPASGTLVGSPVTITGRTNRAPLGGVLSYRIATLSNQQLGEGTLPMQADQPTRFNASLTFTLPQQPSTITIQLFERDSGGAPIASSTVELVVNPPPPGIQPRAGP
jgi:hypothetical protein